MAIEDHVKIAKSGVAAIKAWKRKNPYEVFDLSGADLGGADLGAADLRGAELSGANLSRAKLGGANLCPGRWQHVFPGALPRTTRLVKANLAGAILADTKMIKADLRSADLENSDIRGANLTGAKLAGANLAGVIYDDTTNWPKGFRPERFVVKKLNVALDTEKHESTHEEDRLSADSKASFSQSHLLRQESELQHNYNTLSKRIAALDTDLGRALDTLSRQVLEEQRKEFAAQRDEIAAQMAQIEKQLGK